MILSLTRRWTEGSWLYKANVTMGNMDISAEAGSAGAAVAEMSAAIKDEWAKTVKEKPGHRGGKEASK